MGVMAVLLVAALQWLQASAAEDEGDGDKPPTQAEIEASEALLHYALEPWTGDLQGIRARRILRVLVTYDGIDYFIDRYRQRGLTYEIMKMFERDLNRELKLRAAERITFVFIPVQRDRLISGLADGIGDIAAADLTITPDRLALVDFSVPLETNVSEVLVTGPSSPLIKSLDDLPGKEIVVRHSSSYFESLQAINERFRATGKPEIQIVLADERLEDNGIAEMVNAGLYPAMVMDRHEAELRKHLFPKIVDHDDIVFRKGGKIGWAFRKESPDLKKAIDRFVARHGADTRDTATLIKRYRKSDRYVKNALSEKERKKFEETVELFKRYGDKYDFDWLLLVAMGYQESRLDQNAKSSAGAVGIMQLLPSTAAAPPISIPDISKADPNIHAGAKYLRYIVDQYFSDASISELNRQLFAFASYNAGPNLVVREREKAAKHKLDPDKWFDNVEIMVGRAIGGETVSYVSNIFKYYVAYKRAEKLRAQEDKAVEKVKEASD